jgi:UDP-N-acetyl-2-amino-2-deoxyglucuronate dehydrogenase
MNKFSFVIIGVGNIGSKYVRLLKEINEAELVAAVDTDFFKRKTINKLIPFFNNIDDFLIAKIPADVVCICTPNGLHPSQTIKCLNQGYHVICEKPVALKESEVYNMMEAEKKSGKRVFAVMQNRYSPVAIWLKKIMSKQMIGELLFLQINCFWNRNQMYYDDSPWRGTLKLGGGPLYTQFSHFIDLMIWICSKPTNIKSNLFNLNENIKTEFDDSGIINFKFENGGRGVFNFTNATFNANVESSLTIIGSKGNVKVGGQYMEKLDFINMSDEFEIPVFDKVTQANQYSYYKGSADKHDVFLQKVIECLKTGSSPEIGLEDELNVIHFIEQAMTFVESENY